MVYFDNCAGFYGQFGRKCLDPKKCNFHRQKWRCYKMKPNSIKTKYQKEKEKKKIPCYLVFLGELETF